MCASLSRFVIFDTIIMLTKLAEQILLFLLIYGIDSSSILSINWRYVI